MPNRPLTSEEHALLSHMLTFGLPEAKDFLPQLQIAEVTDFKCPCGCPSFNLQLRGHPEAPPGVHILGDFQFGDGKDTLNAIFIYESGGLLSGVELTNFLGPMPASLPTPDQLGPNIP